MAMLTQGTQLYVLAPKKNNPNEYEVLEVGCPTSINPGDETADDIDATCLGEKDTRTILPGLTTPGEATISVNTDSKSSSHVRLFELKSQRIALKWAIGASDGSAPPVVNTAGDGFNLPTSRTWWDFKGTLATFSFNFEGNSVVTSELTIKREGALTWTPKA